MQTTLIKILTISFLLIQTIHIYGQSQRYITPIHGEMALLQQSLDQDFGMKLQKTNIGHNGIKHHKFSQFIKGLEVLNATYIVHEKNGQAYAQNGRIYQPIITHTGQLAPYQFAQVLGSHELLKSINPNIATFPKAPSISITKSEKVLCDVSFPSFTDELTEAYLVHYTIADPYDKRRAVIHAQTKKIIYEESTICTIGVPSKGQSWYYGEVAFTSDSLSPNSFVLRDPDRNITTYTQQSGPTQQVTGVNSTWDFDNKVTGVAVDAHYCTSRFHDMMHDLFDWKGLDGEGLNMDPVVNINGGSPFVNAYWDGERAYFGNGDCHYDPLTTLSVVGHEFMHGITDYTSDLIYADESGAINESMSDIFGKALEYKYDYNRFSWELGPEFARTMFATIFRSMKDPNVGDNPKTYKGLYWQDGGGVHSNSGVFNYWFYLMVQGGEGFNEWGEAYIVDAQPIDEVLNIVFSCQKNYLTPTSNYPELYELSLAATEELYGANSSIFNAVREAWIACGLPLDKSHLPQKDLSISLTNIPDDFGCFQDFIDFDIVIKNVGKSIINKGFELPVNIRMINDDLDKYYTLDLDLEPGESIVFPIRNEVENDGSSLIIILLHLDVLDDNFPNNSTFTAFENFQNLQPDLNVFANISNSIQCFQDKLDVNIDLINNSCSTIEANTPFTLNIYKNTTLVYTLNQSFPVKLEPGDNYYLQATITNLDLTTPSPLSVEIVSPIDTDPDNNVTELYFEPVIVNDKPFDLDFTTNLLASYFNILSYENQLEVISEQNDNKLAIFNYFNFEEYPCISKEDFIEKYSLTYPVLSTCIDATNLSAPRFSLELKQNEANETSIPFKSGARNVFIVELINNDGIIVKEYYSSKTKIDIIHDLPSNFKGKLNMYSYSFSSSFGDSYNNRTIDANIIDNIVLSETTSTSFTNLEGIEIYPNPTNNILYIKERSSGTIFSKIMDIHGQYISSHPNESQISVEHLSPGMYLIEVENMNGSRHTTKFVKI